MVERLPKPARFYPLAHGKYEVAAGLRPLGTDTGNGAMDSKCFLLDSEFPKYRKAKELARAERLEKYYPPSVDFSPPAYRAVTRFLVDSLVREWPEQFYLSADGGRSILECTLTAERIVFDGEMNLVSASTAMGGPTPPYRDLFDALASQIQEDLSVWMRSATETAPDPMAGAENAAKEWMGAIHLCYPNHWSAEEKIGRTFNHVHIPVAGFGKLAKAAPGLVEMMTFKGPFTRFAWGVATDTELNHHPKNEFQGRQFDAANPGLYLRIERQTLTSFPDVGASLFTIRTYFLDCAKDLSASERDALSRAIDSMTPESLVYKGLTKTKEPIKAWLASLV